MEFVSLPAMIDEAYAAVKRRIAIGSWPKGWPGNLYPWVVRFAAVDPELAQRVAKERPEWYELSDKVGGNTAWWLDAIKTLQNWDRFLPAAVQPAADTPTNATVQQPDESAWVRSSPSIWGQRFQTNKELTKFREDGHSEMFRNRGRQLIHPHGEVDGLLGGARQGRIRCP